MPKVPNLMVALPAHLVQAPQPILAAAFAGPVGASQKDCLVGPSLDFYNPARYPVRSRNVSLRSVTLSCFGSEAKQPIADTTRHRLIPRRLSDIRQTMTFVAPFPQHGRAPRSRRVLQVITSAHMSGAEMQVVRITRQMLARGHVFSAVIQHNSPALPEMRRRGLDVCPLSIGGKLNLAAVPVLARHAQKLGAELLHSSNSTASWWCGWLDRLGGPPSVGHVHGFTSAQLWHSNQSHLLAVSGAVKADLIRQGLSADRITILHNAVDPQEFVPTRDPLQVRSELGAEADTPIVGTFGHLSEKKGHRDLFQAIPTVLSECPTAQFWVVGQGRLREELETTARRHGFLSHVRLLGYRQDAADLMNAIDVLALPSHREPFGLVYVEAALLNKPIVACQSGGAPETIADRETGILVPVRDSRAIAAAISTLLTNRDVGRRMGRDGHARALELFSWKSFIQTLEGVYERVLDERAAAVRLRRLAG